MGNKEYEDLLVEEQKSEVDRASYREDIGTFESDPEINEKIKKYHGNRIAREQPKKDGGLESKATSILDIKPEILAQAVRVVGINKGPGEYVPKHEYLSRISKLRSLGFPLDSSMTDYRKMSKGRVHHVFNGLASKIRARYQAINSS